LVLEKKLATNNAIYKLINKIQIALNDKNCGRRYLLQLGKAF
jgi:hypothetical protein